MNPAGENRVLICFTAGRPWWSRILRRVMRCEINHVMTLYSGELWGGWWAVQVDEMGVRLVPALRALSGCVKILCYEYRASLMPGLLSMRDYIGQRYDWRGLAWGVIRILLQRIFGNGVHRAWHSYNRMFCSEFVATMLQRAKVPGAETWDPSSIPPSYLLNFVQAGEFTKIEWPS